MKNVLIAMAILGASMSAHAAESISCKFNGSTTKVTVDDAGNVTYKIGRRAEQQGLRVVGPEVYNKFELKEMLEMNGIDYNAITGYSEVILSKTVETSSIITLSFGDVQKNYLRGGGMVVACE